jgi:hypothetical protein
MARPVINRLAYGKFRWEVEIRGMLPAHLYGTALMLGTFANADGSQAFPGEQQLADAIRVTTRTVRTNLAWLDTLGWITRVHAGSKSGSKRGFADKYQLTLPAPLAAKLGEWNNEQAQWMAWWDECIWREYYHGR